MPAGLGAHKQLLASSLLLTADAVLKNNHLIMVCGASTCSGGNASVGPQPTVVQKAAGAP